MQRGSSMRSASTRPTSPGVSMGGMIAQAMAIEHPERVRSLTSIMSTTGDLDVGQPTAEASTVLLSPPPDDEDAAVAQNIRAAETWGSPDHLDEAWIEARTRRAWQRDHDARGIGRQLAAITASGSRTAALRDLDVAATVVHGDADTLVQPSGGERTAEAIPGAELVVVDGMGHDLPPPVWPNIVEAILSSVTRSR